MPYCPECGEEVKEDAKFCNNCGASLTGGGKAGGVGGKTGRTSMDIEENVEGALCYALFWVTGIIFLILEEKSDFVRFHAMQSIVVFLPLMIVSFFFSMVFWPLGWIFSLLILALWLILMFKAYNGERFKLPVAGDIAEDQM